MTMPKPDFRNQLNTLLAIFYHSNNVVAIKHLVVQGNTGGLSYQELNTCYDTLLADGYIQHVYPVDGWKELKVGAITGQGRIFFEQGGYKDQRNQLDKTMDWFKNHKLFSKLIIVAIIFTSVWGIAEIVIKIIQLLR